MKNSIVILSVILGMLIFTACNKQSQKEIDDALIVDYITENSIDATKTESGLYYQILDEGNGVSPSVIDDVRVRYEGRFLDGEVFDGTEGSESITFNLSQVILGWQEGLQLMNEGGEALLLIPSHLGYGSSARGSIPANSVLIFNVELIAVE